MLKSCILTPTFSGHFCYIKYYLKSFDKYVKDKNFPIYFIISKSEKSSFSKVLKPFSHLNINVIFFEDILAKFNIKETPNLLLKTYGKFSFQSLKKFYGMLYLEKQYRYFCVLDSESSWVKNSNMKNMINDFFKKPFIFYSDITKRKISSNDNNIFTDIINYVLKDKNNKKWFVEQFYRYWDVKILKDIFDKYGDLYTLVKNVRNFELKKYGKIYGLFESVLYDQYVFNNLKKYNYKAIDIDKMLQKYLGSNFDSYKKMFFDRFYGSCGISEHMLSFLNKDNVDSFIKMAIDNKFNIFRIEETTPENYKYQKKFMEKVQPNMLVCSQAHAFCENKKVIIDIIKRHIHKFLHCYWLRGKK